MTFYAEEIDACPAYGWQGGPNSIVRITKLANQHERRNKPGSLMLHSYTLPFQNIPDEDYLAYIKSAYMAMGGPLDSFLCKDWGDHLATLEPLGVTPSGSTPVQLRKTYSFGSASHLRTITKPLSTIQVFQDTGSGPVLKAGTVDVLTGLFTPTSGWTALANLYWSGEFRVPVRFAQFFLPASIDNRSEGQYATNSSVELIEVPGE